MKRALLAYKSREGDLLVPRGFIIPVEDEWEKELWGVKLGTAVDSIRNNNAYKQYRPELEKMGFDYGPQRTLYGWDLVKRALQAYKDVVGDLLVPRGFIIPEEYEWEKELWGVKLGIAVSCIRNKNFYKQYRPELEKMGFDYDRQGYGWDLMERALLTYKDKVGDLLVPRGFIIPEEDEWEKILWGVKLGTAVGGIRNNNVYKQYRPDLEEMGFDYDRQFIQMFYGWDLVKRALLAYKDRVGHMRVPSRFAIPKDDASWEKELWGIKLGNSVQNIRNRNNYEERREELETMGFDFSSQR
jgi:CRISPR/Cas system-associated protein Cas5 (RAMP superfamily)